MLKKALIATILAMLIYPMFADKALEKNLCDLSNKSAFACWDTKSGAAMNRTPLKVEGRYVLEFKAPKYYAGSKNQWPSIIWRAPVPAGMDWSRYDLLQVDCYLKTNNPVLLGAVFRDSGNKRFFEKKSLFQGGAWTTLTFKLQKNNIDTSKLKTFNFYITRPGQDVQMLFSNIRLVSELPDKLTSLEKAYRRIGRSEAKSIADTLQQVKDEKMAAGKAHMLAEEWLKKLRGLQLDKIRYDFAKVNKKAKFSVAFADAGKKIFPKERPVEVKSAEKCKVSLARNEREGFQLVVVGPEHKGLKAVSVVPGKFVLQGKPDISLPEEAVQAFPIGFVKTKKPLYHIDFLGWYPDPILEHLKSVEIKADEVQPFWVRIKTDSKTVPGLYNGMLKVKTAGSGSVKVPVKIKVWKFSMPQRMKLKTATSSYGSPLLPSRDEVYDYLIERYRLNPFSIYSGSAYGKPTLLPVSAYTKRLKMGLNFIPMLYLKLPRQYMHKCRPRESKAKWQAMSKEQKKHYPEAGKREYLKYLDKLVPEFKKAGIYDIAYCYGFDEAGPDEWPAIVDLCKTIKKKYPDLKIITTAYDQSYGTQSVLGEVITGWIPHDNMYDPALAAKARKGGKQVWWYSTHFFIDANKLWDIRRTMGEDGFKKGVDGFLYWTVTRWNSSNKKPINMAPYTNWNPMTFPGNNGGGSFFCAAPGKKILPTIRAEAIRDGIEDYEYFHILKKLSKELPDSSVLKKQADALLNAPVAGSAETMSSRREKIGNLIDKINESKRK
jgi:hypothetical protein